MTDTWMWVLAAHLIGVFLWIGGLFTTYWLLRIHVNAPKDALEKLILMERSLALMMDIAATLAIGTGLYLAISIHLFTMPHSGWFHAKLAVVILGILSVHGMVRAKVGKLSRGVQTNVPQWAWSLLLASLCAIVILVVKKPF
jgi:putative membrane protein